MNLFDELLHTDVQDAADHLARTGFRYRIEKTNPPKRPIEGEERVARIRQEGDTVIVTTAVYVKEK